MEYMVIEKFKPNCLKMVYERFNEKGRLMPEGLEYIDSWISKDLNICFQVMKSPNRELLDEWISNWIDLTDFEVIETISSAEAKKIILK